MKRSRFLVTLSMIPVTAKFALARLFYPWSDRSMKGSSGITESWKAGGPDIIEVWNRRVDPSTDPLALSRKVRPVTREDLDNKFQTTGMRQFRTPDHETNMAVNYKEDLDLYTRIYELGDLLWIYIHSGLIQNNSKDVVDEIARRKLYLFDIWGVDTPSHSDPLSPAPEMNRYMQEKLGKRFLGWDNGERDGQWVRANAWVNCPAPVTRKQAFENWVAFFSRLNDSLFNYMTALGMLPLMHYLADLYDVRMIGPETIQMDPCIPVWFGNIRGAGKQYGILWFGNISSFTRFDWGNEGGPGISLRKRLWYVETMYDSCVMGYEAGHLHPTETREVEFEGETREVPVLDLNGKLQMEGIEWCRKHPARGIMHTPVALVWDFYSGWLPPRVDTNGPYTVWGNLPYEKGDHQIDMIYRELYPGYEDASYFKDERGYLTPTPHGDVFDVLLSNVSRSVLNRYNAALIMGETKIEGQLLDTVRDFLNRGGSVATTASQLTPESALLLGVKIKGGTMSEQNVRIVAGDKELHEPLSFTFHILDPLPGTEVLVSSSDGSPLAFRRETEAGGSILLFAADYGLSDWIESFRIPVEKLTEVKYPREVFDFPVYDALIDTPLPSPYAIPEHIREILLPWLEQWNLLDVEGPPVQYLLNLTEDPDRFIVTLSNNSKSPWEGEVVFRNASISSGENWMSDEKIESGDSATVKLPPEEVVVLELKTDRPLVRFKTDSGPDPSGEELQLVSETIRKKAKSLTPELMLAEPKPEIPYIDQKPEKPGSIYINSWLFGSTAPEEWIKPIANMGLDGVEIRATDLYDPSFEEMRSRFSDAGLRIGAVNAAVDVTPYSFGSIGLEIRRRNEPTVKWLEQVIEIMSSSGLNRLIIRGDRSYHFPERPDKNDVLSENLERLAQRARKLDVKILLENVAHWGFQFLEAADLSHELIELVEKCDNRALRAAFDPAHARIAGEDPLQAFQRVSESGLLEYVHMSNCISPEVTKPMILDQHVPLENGDISLDVYEKILREISDENLAASIHLMAPEKPLQTLQKTLKIIRQM